MLVVDITKVFVESLRVVVINLRVGVEECLDGPLELLREWMRRKLSGKSCAERFGQIAANGFGVSLCAFVSTYQAFCKYGLTTETLWRLQVSNPCITTTTSHALRRSGSAPRSDVDCRLSI